MGYLNGKEIFPPALLEQIQQYAQGTCVYIPRNEAGRKTVRRGDRAYLNARNAEICRKYSLGVSVRRLSEEYYLSTQAIYKIIARCRK